MQYLSESELPPTLTDEERAAWFESSWIQDGVRIGLLLGKRTDRAAPPISPVDEFFNEWRRLICPDCDAPLEDRWCVSCKKRFDEK